VKPTTKLQAKAKSKAKPKLRPKPKAVAQPTGKAAAKRRAKPTAKPAVPTARKARSTTRGVVTMADVAARVGVSKMTVSRALNRRESHGSAASEAQRQVILQTCRDMGYVMDQTARSLSSQRSGFVAAVIPVLNNSNFSETVAGLTTALQAEGLQLLLGCSDYKIENEERLVRELLARRPEGVILTGGAHTAGTRAMLEASGIPVVETWDLPLQPIGHVVGFSNAAAASALVHHLHDKGYRRIAFVGGSSNRDTRGADRRRGYTDAIRQLGLPRGLVISFGQPPISMALGAQGVVQLVQQWPDVDAAVFVADLSAFGALAECQRRGWSVPGRLAIAGFGDFEVARHCQPRITTVHVDCEGIGRAAGELLVRAIAGSRDGWPLPPETVLMPFSVVPRESS
jgi:LacI family transcriptional regulator, gluconate utilization system Gnt-I transcriptional repressor